MPMWLGKYNAYYTEPYPLQQWKMGAETQTILGHRCQKATCHWRGRDFVAWFAPDIPVKAGPWKFGGLPGLILKLQDTAGVYRFEAVQISSRPYPIYKYDYPRKGMEDAEDIQRKLVQGRRLSQSLRRCRRKCGDGRSRVEVYAL